MSNDTKCQMTQNVKRHKMSNDTKKSNDTKCQMLNVFRHPGKFSDSLERGNLSDSLETSEKCKYFPDGLENFWTVRKLSQQSGNFLDSLESLQMESFQTV